MSKQNLYSPDDQYTSNICRAFSHSARIQILKQLQTHGSLCVQVIAKDHPISHEALSNHLKILREAHLVVWEERFPFTFYAIHKSNMRKAIRHLKTFLQIFEGLLDEKITANLSALSIEWYAANDAHNAICIAAKS